MDAPFRPPLRGREQELAVIRRKLSQVRAGTGCVVAVEGSAGLGKTRLLDECVSMAGELSFRVGRGAAEPGRVIELGALFDALFEGDPPLADRRALNDVHASSEFLFWLLQDVQFPSSRRPRSRIPCLSVLMICTGAGPVSRSPHSRPGSDAGSAFTTWPR